MYFSKKGKESQSAENTSTSIPMAARNSEMLEPIPGANVPETWPRDGKTDLDSGNTFARQRSRRAGRNKLS